MSPHSSENGGPRRPSAPAARAPPGCSARASWNTTRPPGATNGSPRGPVELATGLGVIAVDEHHVHLALPACGQVVGEERRAGPRRLADRPRARVERARPHVGSPTRWRPHPLGSASGCAHEGRASIAARHPTRASRTARRRGSLVDADLDHALRIARPLPSAHARPPRNASSTVGSNPSRRPARAGAHRHAGVPASSDAGLLGRTAIGSAPYALATLNG